MPGQTKHSPYSCLLGVRIHLWSFFILLLSSVILQFSPLTTQRCSSLSSALLPPHHPNVSKQGTSLSSLAKAARLADKAIGFASIRGRVKSCLRSRLCPAPGCRVESGKSRRCSLAPRQQHRQHFSLFNLDVPLKFPLQT